MGQNQYLKNEIERFKINIKKENEDYHVKWRGIKKTDRKLNS